MTDTQHPASKAIVNIYEMESVQGGHGKVTCIGDTGGLSVRTIPETLNSGNLFFPRMLTARVLAHVL